MMASIGGGVMRFAGQLRHSPDLKPRSLSDLLVKRYKWKDSEAKSFADFLRPMLAYDTKQRARASDCLQHPWLAGVSPAAKPPSPPPPPENAKAAPDTKEKPAGEEEDRKKRDEVKGNERKEEKDRKEEAAAKEEVGKPLDVPVPAGNEGGEKGERCETKKLDGKIGEGAKIEKRQEVVTANPQQKI